MANRQKRARRSLKAGLPPGTMVHIGEKRAERVRIDIIRYTPEKFESYSLDNIEDAYSLKDRPEVNWINISGLHEPQIIQKIGGHFDIHPLLLEDILNTDQRPKIDFSNRKAFVVLQVIRFDRETGRLSREQASIVVGPNYVITFLEGDTEVFDPLRERIKGARGRVRQLGTDYLFYALMDVIVDYYFLVLEEFGDYIGQLEDEVIERPDKRHLDKIRQIKSELNHFRRSVWPLRDVLNSLLRDAPELIKKETRPFLRDLYDHTLHISDSIDVLRETVAGLLEIYLSNISNKMNEVMKVLTIIATIFIPLSFIAGIYGMNFEFMPELKWRWGYFVVWGFCLTVSIGMLYYFRKKDWL